MCYSLLHLTPGSLDLSQTKNNCYANANSQMTLKIGCPCLNECFHFE